MAMSREEHEALLTELMDNPSEDRKVEILQSLRAADTAHHEAFEEVTNALTESQESEKALQKANSQLFRQAYTEAQEDDEHDEPDTSETITITDLEKPLD